LSVNKSTILPFPSHEQQQQAGRHDGESGGPQVIVVKLCQPGDCSTEKVRANEWNHAFDNEVERKGRQYVLPHFCHSQYICRRCGTAAR
jgi:hypothetical protein